MAFPFIAWTNKVNRKDKVDASHVNNLAKAINDGGTYTDAELAKINNIIGGSTGGGILVINTSTPTSINGLLVGDGTNVMNITGAYIDWDATSGSNSIKNKPTILIRLSGTGTIPVGTSWNSVDGEGYYTYSLTATGVLSTDDVDITRVLNMSDAAASELIQAAWNNINDVVISANTLTFYAAEAPAVAIPIAWKVVR